MNNIHTSTVVEKRLCPPHAKWCAWVFDEVMVQEHGLFSVIEHACNCPARTEWETK